MLINYHVRQSLAAKKKMKALQTNTTSGGLIRHTGIHNKNFYDTQNKQQVVKSFNIDRGMPTKYFKTKQQGFSIW